MDDADYMTVEEAAGLLGLTTRQVRRYKTKVRSVFVGRRLLLHRGDIQNLAALKQVERDAQGATHPHPIPKQPVRAEVLMPAEPRAYVRERDTDWVGYTERLNQQLLQAVHRIGELETQLAQRLLPQEAAALQQQLADLQKAQEQLSLERNTLQQQYDQLHADHTQLQQELVQLKRPWWKRLWWS